PITQAARKSPFTQHSGSTPLSKGGLAGSAVKLSPVSLVVVDLIGEWNMAEQQAGTAPIATTHGATRLPAVDVDSYNLELRDDEGFIGDRASKGAFRVILENWRKAMRKNGEDPFGEEASEDISKKKLDSVLTDGDPEAAGVLQGAIEDFAGELALIVRRFLKTKGWRDTDRIMIGGGFRASRVGELAIGRASVILKAEDIALQVIPIRNDPDEAGLLGAAQLAPSWVFQAHD